MVGFRSFTDASFAVESGYWHLVVRGISIAMAAHNLPPHSLGLGGDGDEIAAIEEVERCFGVRLDYSDSAQWKTVGDVFVALQRTLPKERAEAQETWQIFASAISGETGVDPSLIIGETLLLAEGRFDWRVLVLVGCLVGLAVAIIVKW